MKTNEQGDSIWLKNYGGHYVDLSASVFYRTDTTLLLFSDLSLAPNNDDIIWLLETDLEGNVVWENTYGDEYGMVGRQDIVQLDNGDIVFSYLSCDQSGFCIDDWTLKLTKINASGEELWTKDAYYFDELWSASSIVALDNGGFLLSFYRMNFDDGWFYPPILIWLDSMGNFVQQYEFPADTESSIQHITKTNSGVIVGAGYVDKLDLGFAGWVFAMSQEGELLWNREIVDLRFPAKLSQLNAVLESENGGLILTGAVMDTFLNHIPAINNQNIWLVKLDSIGCLEPGCGDLQILTDTKEVATGNDLFTIYPNPTGRELFFGLNEAVSRHDNLTVVISNSTGQKVLVIKLNDKEMNVLDVSSLVIGTYFIQIINESGVTVQTDKFVVIK